jgi:hypothetical protein
MARSSQFERKNRPDPKGGLGGECGKRRSLQEIVREESGENRLKIA